MDTENTETTGLSQPPLPFPGLESNGKQEGGKEGQAQPLKICTKCKEPLPPTTEFFFRSWKSKDGLMLSCKRCRNGTPSVKVCSKCRAELPPTQEFFTKHPKAKGGLCPWCRQCDNKRRSAWREARRGKPARILLPPKTHEQQLQFAREQNYKLKHEVFAAYGNRCACCGESRPIFLTIEHTNRDGAQHRRAIGGGGTVMYRFLKKNGFPQSGYALFCMNCNWATRLGQPCPHQDNAVAHNS